MLCLKDRLSPYILKSSKGSERWVNNWVIFSVMCCFRLWLRDLVFSIFSVGDYAGDSASSNYSDQFKNLDKFVKSLDKDILSELEGSSNSGSSSNPRR